MAKINEIDIIKADVSSILQKVRYETEEVTINPSTEIQTVIRSPEKYIDKVIVNPVTSAIDPEIQAENIKEGINILGKEGTFTSDATAKAEDILQDKTAYAKGEKVVGTLAPEEITITPTEEEQVFEGIYNKVTVEKAEGAGGIKFFETEEELRAYNPNEGDVVLVHGNKNGGLVQNVRIKSLTFPRTVVLSEAITATISVSGSYKGISGNFSISGSIRPTQASLSISGLKYYSDSSDSYVSIRYTSTDGITYTRTDTYADTYILKGDIVLTWTKWNDLISNFIIYEGINSSGLLEYNLNVLDNNKMYWCNVDDMELEWDSANNKITSARIKNSSEEVLEASKLKAVADKFKADTTSSTVGTVVFFKDKDDKLKMVYNSSTSVQACYLCYNYNNSNKLVGFCSYLNDINCTVYDVDIENASYSNGVTLQKNTSVSRPYCAYTNIKTVPVALYMDSGTIGLFTSLYTIVNSSCTITNTEVSKYYSDRYLPITPTISIEEV